MDQQTLDTLREIHTQLQLDDEAPYETETSWEEEEEAVEPGPLDLQYIYDRVISLTGKIRKKLKKNTKHEASVQQPEHVGDEMVQQLIEAWDLHTRGADQIPCRDIGYILRILGQNPTEDDIVEMVMEANCDWEGIMTKEDFLQVGEGILRSSCDQMDDVKAAFRVFDYNNDGSISREELRGALVNFGERCTEEEFSVMFSEADKNKNGRIDFDEFVDMMLPGVNKSPLQRGPDGPLARQF